MKRILACIVSLILLAGIITFPVSADTAENRTQTAEISEKAASQKIHISGSKYVARGKKITLKATFSSADVSQEVTWKSSDRKIAKVSSKGVVKGIRAGKVKITAKLKSDKKVIGTISIKVMESAVKKIEISGTRDLCLSETKTVTLKAKAVPSDAAQSFQWKSSNKDVATVSSKGKVTAKAAGTVKITAAATDGSGKKATVTIKVTRDTAGSKLLQTLSRYTFTMSSGAGAWADTLKIKSDGTYSGEYYDSDMGDTGPGYPDGTVYVGTYKGKLGNVRKHNKYLYKMTVIKQTMDDRPDEEIVDGIRYISSKGGLPSGSEVFVCIPGTPMSYIPEDAWMWFMGPSGDFDMTETTTYGIFTQNGSCGFINLN